MGTKEMIAEHREKAMENYVDFNANSKRADGDTNSASPKKNNMKSMTLIHIGLFSAGVVVGYVICKMRKV